MANVNYLCCPGCHGWYREGDAHMCGSGHPDNIEFRQEYFSDTERLYTLLERIATALERLVEK